MRQFFVVLVAALLLCCGDDSSTPTGDSGTHDQGVVPDGKTNTDGPAGDTGPTPDGAQQADGATELSCGEIGTCSEECGNKCPSGAAKLGCLMTCNTDCKALGCDSAKPLFETLATCIQSKCIAECIGGPSTGCTDCTTTKCATETNACNAHTC
jgi:hypothetical protein